MMKIERTLDVIHFTPEELQAVLREHISNTTGRVVHGDVNFQQSNADKGSKYSAWARLEDTPNASA